ncbi:MAG TPA: serine/threonine-protein kinase, partial [Phototrophicaceae bacterium]|nr:serine/threonine-protein kinase [Phototrophicaceae bacterium]
MADNISRQIKGYELREKLGEGGFGAVYRAFQLIVEREVAIKFILPDYANQPEFIRRFDTEAQLVARLEHPYIVPMFDYWRDPEGAYLVMRWIRGGSLRHQLKANGIPSLHSTARIIEQISAALSFAHRSGIVHRDMKPDNVLIDEEGNAYLTDFGIAQVTGKVETSQVVSGTLDYISPEQLRGSPPAPGMDIYSFGVMIYELLTGEPPFLTGTPSQKMNSHLYDPLPMIRDLRPDLPPGVDKIISKATAKEADERYQDVRELSLDFQRVLSPDDRNLRTSTILQIEPTNPYKGLRPFDEADAADFFGREELVDQILSNLSDDQRFLAVIGPSGSGKSSVVLAGVIPLLREGNIEGSEKWFIASMVPGSQPVHNLVAALLSVATHPPTHLIDQLRSSTDGLVWAVEGLMAGTEGDLLLVIDQFEEVFTLVSDETERQHFLQLLHRAVTADGSRLRVMITLRADFYDRPLLYEGFGALVEASTRVVLPLTAGEVERAISGPAQRVGLHVDTDLVAAMVNDVREQPGALPLLQYALTEIYERREGQALTLRGYTNSGGVLGALARRAEEVYEELSSEQQT